MLTVSVSQFQTAKRFHKRDLKTVERPCFQVKFTVFDREELSLGFQCRFKFHFRWLVLKCVSFLVSITFLLASCADIRLWQCGKPTASTPRKSDFALNTPQLVFLCTVYTPKYRNTLGMHAHAQRAAPPLLRGSELGLDDDNPRIYIQWYLTL